MRGEGFVTSHTRLSRWGGIVVQNCLLPMLMGSFSLGSCLLTNPYFRTVHRVFWGMVYPWLLNLRTGNLQMFLEVEGLA